MRSPSGENTVAPKCGDRLAVAVPQARGVVGGGSQDAAPVGRKHRACDRAGVAQEGGEQLAGAVPQPRRPVVGGGHDAAVVGAKTALRTAPLWPSRVASGLS